MIIHGDCLEEMKKLPEGSVDCIVTDPPYGYSFMGKDWDKAVPSVEIWRECLRVLKPGAFAFVMSAPRQDVLSQMIVRLTEAGFKTDFTSIYWTYSSGFPKAANIGKMVDKRMGVEREVVGPDPWLGRDPRGKKPDTSVFTDDNWVGKPDTEQGATAPATPQAKALDGSYGGFQPKPAVEIIIVCMKPLSEKTYVDQALKNGHGVTWLDDCRVPTDEKVVVHFYPGEDALAAGKGKVVSNGKMQSTEPVAGRFPANLIVSDDVLNDGKERKGSHDQVRLSDVSAKFAWKGHAGDIKEGYADSGSYSRYFSLDSWHNALPESVQKTFPFLIVAKASKREKDKGCEAFEIKRPDTRTSSGMGSFEEKGVLPGKNPHPTCKPITLMSYLITLGSRPGDTILDPFVGSGTTVCAAKALGRIGIGIEREEEYIKIAEARLAAVKV